MAYRVVEMNLLCLFGLSVQKIFLKINAHMKVLLKSKMLISFLKYKLKWKCS